MGTRLTKYDHINRIHYTLTMRSSNPSDAIKQLYDCTLMPYNVTYLELGVYASDMYNDYIGDIEVYDMKSIIRNDIPASSIIDGMYMHCRSTNTCPLSGGPRVDYIKDYINTSIGRAIAYIRSMDANSYEYMPTLVQSIGWEPPT